MRRAEIVTAILLAVLSFYLMWKSGEPPSWNPEARRFANIGFIEGEGPGSGFWPFWLSLVMLVTSIWTMVRWVQRKSPPSRSDAPFIPDDARKTILLVAASIVAFLALIHIIGFYFGMLVFMLWYIRFMGKHRWWVSIAVSTGVTVFSFFFFDIAMRIVLPKAYSEPLFIPLYAIFL